MSHFKARQSFPSSRPEKKENQVNKGFAIEGWLSIVILFTVFQDLHTCLIIHFLKMHRQTLVYVFFS